MCSSDLIIIIIIIIIIIRDRLEITWQTAGLRRSRDCHWRTRMSKLLLKELRTCRAKAAEAEAAERRPRSRARKRDDEGDATSEAEAAEEEGDAVDKRAEAAEEEGVYIRGWYFKKRAASAGGTSPAPLRPRHHRDTSSTVTIAASQECEPGVVREQDTRCQECQSEGSQDILELPEGEQCSAPPISSSSTAERSVPIFKMDPELARKSKAEPFVVPATSARAADAPAEDAPAEDASAASGWQLWDFGSHYSWRLGGTAHTDVVPDEDVPARHSY